MVRKLSIRNLRFGGIWILLVIYMAAGGNDDVRDGFVPFAAVVEAGDGADGVENAFGVRDLHAADLLDNTFGGETNVLAAALEETGGVGVAVDAARIFDFEDFSEVSDVAPIEEVLFEGLTEGVIADGAFAAVALQFRFFRFGDE